MLIATRDYEPRASTLHSALTTPPRSMASRFTSGVQLLGSLVGIPLALIGGYSTYHANFSPEAKCQSLRANIIAMLDKKADASTLRLLVQRDVVAFERDCGAVDAEATAAFKTLLAAEKTAPARRVEPRAKSETAIAERPAKAEKAETAVKVEQKKPQATVALKRDPQKIEETKPVEATVARLDVAHVDTAWVSSVREALRESASRPPAEEAAELAAPMPPPIVVPTDSKLARDAAALIEMRPRKPDHPVPPAPIPDTNGRAQPAD